MFVALQVGGRKESGGWGQREGPVRGPAPMGAGIGG